MLSDVVLFKMNIFKMSEWYYIIISFCLTVRCLKPSPAAVVVGSCLPAKGVAEIRTSCHVMSCHVMSCYIHLFLFVCSLHQTVAYVCGDYRSVRGCSEPPWLNFPWIIDSPEDKNCMSPNYQPTDWQTEKWNLCTCADIRPRLWITVGASERSDWVLLSAWFPVCLKSISRDCCNEWTAVLLSDIM